MIPRGKLGAFEKASRIYRQVPGNAIGVSIQRQEVFAGSAKAVVLDTAFATLCFPDGQRASARVSTCLGVVTMIGRLLGARSSALILENAGGPEIAEEAT